MSDLAPDSTHKDHGTRHESLLEISVVLPSHNEEKLLGATVTNIATGLTQRSISYEILIVENGSTDGTLRLARHLSAQIPAVRVLTLPVGNYGLALRAGFEASRGTIVVNFDVDYYDLGFLDNSLALLDGPCDLVLASKRAIGSRDRRPIFRRALTAGFAKATHSLIGLEVSDAHGMKAMRRERLVPIIEQCTMTGSVFDVEMVFRATQAGHQLREVPAVVVERRPPRTSVALRIVEAFVGLVRLRLAIRRHG